MRLPVSAPRTVIGYHGCPQATADAIIAEGGFRPSENRYDWLGQGIYFWEYAPYRALEWARLVSLESGDAPAVLMATIWLGHCVNLMDIAHHDGLAVVHDALFAALGAERMPRNNERGGHYLDRLVIDTFCDEAVEGGEPFDTVRGTFAEGEPIYPGSKILSRTHTQIAVRSSACILSLEQVEMGG